MMVINLMIQLRKNKHFKLKAKDKVNLNKVYI